MTSRLLKRINIKEFFRILEKTQMKKSTIQQLLTNHFNGYGIKILTFDGYGTKRNLKFFGKQIYCDKKVPYRYAFSEEQAFCLTTDGTRRLRLTKTGSLAKIAKGLRKILIK